MELVTMSEAFRLSKGNFGRDWTLFHAKPFIDLGIWTVNDGYNMNELYFQFRSGKKYYMGDDIDNAVTRATVISSMLTFNFGENWKRLYATLKPPDYDPLTNYKMEETISGTESSTRTPNITRNHTGTDKNDGTTHVNNQSNLWGFNSDTSVPSDMSDGDTTVNTTNTRNLTDTETGTDTTAGENTRNLTRTGNIGTNTFQNLINQERDLWKWNFYEQVFRDVDSVITIPIY